MSAEKSNRSSLTRFAWLSIAAALLTITLKTVAYLLTGSVGLLSDAMESGVNLIGAMVALAMLTVAARPADKDHAFGHHKAEYFSSGVEGGLILIAAISIGITAVHRLLVPQPIEKVGIGLLVSVAASLINLYVAIVLSKAGKRFNSITLEADAKHLLTDVWTSVGVLVGVGAVAIFKWQPLDSIVALLVAANIVWSGVVIIRKSLLGLMDTALPSEDQKSIQKVLENSKQPNIQYHALRTRQSGSRKFIEFHLLVPGEWTVQQGHQLMEKIEADLRESISQVKVLIHLESIDDPVCWNDESLD